MKFAAFLRLIRWKNLLLIIYLQILLKFLLFSVFELNTNLTVFQFLTLLFSLILITAAGYIINDIFDLKSDLINKPQKVIVANQFSVETSRRLYLITNTMGIVLGIGLSLSVQKPTYAFIFIGASLLLYFYSKKLKSKPLIGNITVSFLVALSIVILCFFDLNLAIQNEAQQLVIYVILLLSGFAFFINMVREIIKDIEDINGDYNLKMNTLPILLGVSRTKKIAAFLCLFPLGLLLFIVVKYASAYKFTLLYLLLFTFVPLLYVALKLLSAKTKKDFKKLSIFLKIIMFLGINTLLIFSLNTN
ncbi:MAG: geranylgeranylglycerol-phosphate geranylgeranyltransferase [Lutibacter sp.]|nr:geranylgeranylglycerol-phosphate geranylgeranyltransferase [Lutibacter sp.]MDT8416604.1 geranylgeranylglycerol-phosphate geranylgeranyltransferase [Lutibacter sp.]